VNAVEWAGFSGLINSVRIIYGAGWPNSVILCDAMGCWWQWGGSENVIAEEGAGLIAIWGELRATGSLSVSS